MTSFATKRSSPPDFLIIGAQKAGTTALYSYLSMHPEIVATAEKELHFFNCDNRYVKGETFYQEMFPATPNNKLTFDASASYLHSQKASARIYNYNPKIKIIALIRNPVNRAYSAWQMYKQRYEKNKNWFYSEWVPFCYNGTNDYKRRREDKIFCFHSFIEEEIDCLEKGITIAAPVITHGFYAKQLDRYFSLFDKNQILIINSEDLRSQTREVLKKIQHFVGVNFYEFKSENLGPVFEGNYFDKMENRTRSLLNDYYGPHNDRLFSILGTRYEW